MIIPLATSALLKMMYSSALAGVGVTVVFSVAILGVIRSSDMRRSHRNAAGSAFAVLGIVGLLVCGVAVVYGLVLVGHKS